jgi:hypothetical protein
MSPTKLRLGFEEETSLSGLAFGEVVFALGRGGSGGGVSFPRSPHGKKLEKTDIEEERGYKFRRTVAWRYLPNREKEMSEVIMCAGTLGPLKR